EAAPPTAPTPAQLQQGFVGPPAPEPVAWRVTSPHGSTIETSDPEAAARVHAAYGGHEAGATIEPIAPVAPEGFVRPPAPAAPPPAAPPGAPPETPRGPLAEGMPEEEEPTSPFQRPVFRRAGGLYKAFTGEDIPGTREPGPERLARQHAAVDRVFA